MNRVKILHPSASAALGKKRSGAIGLLALVFCGFGCQVESELPIRILLPSEVTDLAGANNLTLRFRPSGEQFNYPVDGLDFSVQLPLDPDGNPHELDLFLAQNESLLAWGSTYPFAIQPNTNDLAIYLGRPGALSSFPLAFEAPDPQVLSALALGRGMLLLGADGSTQLLRGYDLRLEAGAQLEAESLPSPTDGDLFPVSDGSVVRLAWEEEIRGWRFDPSADRWEALSLSSEAELDRRTGAAALPTSDREALYLFGGGDAEDVLRLSLRPNSEQTHLVQSVEALELDGPRRGASAIWSPTDPDSALLFGGNDRSYSAVFSTSSGEAYGPEVHWTRAVCAPRDQERVLCLGGLREENATSDAIEIDLSDRALSWREHENLLPVGLSSPLLFSDEFALYTQGEGHFFRVERDDLSVTERKSSSTRAQLGRSVSLENGATFQVGGVDSEGRPVDRWSVFLPAIDP